MVKFQKYGLSLKVTDGVRIYKVSVHHLGYAEAIRVCLDHEVPPHAWHLFDGSIWLSNDRRIVIETPSGKKKRLYIGRNRTITI